MKTYPTASPQFIRPLDLVYQVSLALISGILLFILFLVALVVGFEVYHSEQIYPGVRVGGKDLSGLAPTEAADTLADQLDYPQRGRILLRDGEKIWLASPMQVGLFFDPEVTALAAYQIGRTGNLAQRLTSQFDSLYQGKIIPAQYVYDENTAASFLNEIAAQVDVPTIEAALWLEGTEVKVRQSQVGRRLDIRETIMGIKNQVQLLRDGEVLLVITETPPEITDVNEQVELVRKILSAPLTLTVSEPMEGDPGPWTFEVDQLADMLTIELIYSLDGDHYQVSFDSESLRGFLEEIAPSFKLDAQIARFIFNDETRELEVIQPAVIGRELDIDNTIQAINEKLPTGQHDISLEMVHLPPPATDETTAVELGITELVSSTTTYFYGSSRERIQNIRLASARFHGLLVPPGATFSMVEGLGNVSLDEGYAEALIIYGGRTIRGVGGGVCQVSTTLFRAVFFGGYPIVERNPHAYRVTYYEMVANGSRDANLAGLDAAIFTPVVDFKFTNDSPHWLLMETYVDTSAGTLTWKFYSTSDGRTVEWQSSGLKNRLPAPDPLYEENPELAKGEIKQVDWAAEGADVTISRTVKRGEEVVFTDKIATRYMPWRAVYQYGPGTENMPPDKGDGDGD
jgi:vancomycin resistance protein YoaR